MAGHGNIIGVTSVVPDLQASLGDYRDVLGLDMVEEGRLDADLAASWGAPQSGGRPSALLRPKSGAHHFYRLVEQPDHPDFRPTRTFGWGAYEISVQEVFSWPDKLQGSGFDIRGLPREVPGFTSFVAMQMLGRGQEMLYLNEVRHSTETVDLPHAKSRVDSAFILVLATADREATVAWYVDRLGFDAGDTHTFPYSMINKAFDLPPDNLTTITMVQSGRAPITEIGGYPAGATSRPRHPGMLPPANALVTLAVKDLSRIDVEFLSPPTERQGPMYQGARVATAVGPAGELIELIESAG